MVPFALEGARGNNDVRPTVGVTPQVGCRLRSYLDVWRRVTTDEWVLQVIEVGYQPSFLTQPPLAVFPIGFTPPSDLRKWEFLNEEVRSLVRKGAVFEVPNPGPGFYSNLFLVPKRTGGWRPVINLSRLNRFLIVPHFKMESTRAVSAAVRPGDWAISIDLSDAYFHIPLNPVFQPYTRFVWSGRVYQFRALCFGLATAPRVFTRVVSAVAAFCHLRGMFLHTYLDDWLLRSRDLAQVVKQRDFLLRLARDLGFLVNWEKSSLTPSQDFVYIGVRFRTDLGLSLPPPDRVESILLQTEELSRLSDVPARRLLQWLGLLNSATDHVPWGRLFMRPMQLFLLSQWRPHRDPLDMRISLPHRVLESVWRFWGTAENLEKGMPLDRPVPTWTIETDASLFGWGASLRESAIFASGQWSAEEKKLHINLLELKAVEEALRQWEDVVKGCLVLVRSDNTTTVQYLNRQGGTRSPSLAMSTFRLLMWCRERQITVRAEHIPGRLNLVPDALSRSDRLAPTEWSLPQHYVNWLCDLWLDPKVDLFANRLNRRLPLYVAPAEDPQALHVDALAMSWKNMTGYAFPPIALLPLVLSKVRDSANCRLILIAPLWPRRSWFPGLLEILSDRPRRLGFAEDLLFHHVARRFHPKPEVFNLHAWLVSSVPSERRDFRNKLPRESPNLSDSRLRPYTTLNGASSLVGVVKEGEIHSLPLFN